MESSAKTACRFCANCAIIALILGGSNLDGSPGPTEMDLRSYSSRWVGTGLTAVYRSVSVLGDRLLGLVLGGLWWGRWKLSMVYMRSLPIERDATKQSGYGREYFEFRDQRL
jgi:hypothetical protein